MKWLSEALQVNSKSIKKIMKTIISLGIIFLSVVIMAFGQENMNKGQGSAIDTTIDKDLEKSGSGQEKDVELKMPTFPGGEEALLKFVMANTNYPREARKSKIRGKVYVSFIVDKEGKVKDAVVKKGIGGGCDEEALRVVQMMPQWIPGTQDGRPVDVKFNLPIPFGLN